MTIKKEFPHQLIGTAVTILSGLVIIGGGISISSVQGEKIKNTEIVISDMQKVLQENIRDHTDIKIQLTEIATTLKTLKEKKNERN